MRGLLGVVLLAVAACGSGFRLTDGTLSLVFRAGETYRYHLAVSVNGQVTSSAGATNQLQSGELTYVLKVTSVDPSGTANLVAWAEMGENAYRFPKVSLRVARDGRVVTGRGPVLGDSSVAGPTAFKWLPVADHFLPLLPGRKVGVGNTWKVAYQRSLAYAAGGVAVTAVGRLDRLEGSSGLAVVQSEVLAQPELVIDEEGLFRTMGWNKPVPRAFYRYGGSSAESWTVWLDVGRGRVKRAVGILDKELTMTIEGGTSGVALGSPYRLKANLKIDVRETS